MTNTLITNAITIGIRRANISLFLTRFFNISVTPFLTIFGQLYVVLYYICDLYIHYDTFFQKSQVFFEKMCKKNKKIFVQFAN